MANDKGSESIFPFLDRNPKSYSLDTPPNPEDKIYVADAADKIYQKIADAEKRAQEAEKNSMVDPLTGCFNRNYFNKFKQEKFNPDRDNNNLGLVFVDVNNLKTINDTQGHDAGDELIKNTAIFLKSAFRKDDTVIHLSGDEFMVICRNQENDLNFKDNLPKKISERLTNNSPISIAFGIAVYNKDQDFSNLDKTKDRADQLMYQNKKESKAQK